MDGAGAMTLVQLRYLIAVVDANLNITAAAVRLNATQPGISKQLKLLEDELGFQVFVRKGKSLERTTRAGVEVIERARSVLVETDNIRSLAADFQQQTDGDLRIISTQTQARLFLPRVLSMLKAQYPALGIRQTYFSENPAAASSESESVDLSVVSASDHETVGSPAIPLYRWRRSLLAPAGHPLTRLGRPVTLADIAEHPLVSYPSMARPGSSVARAFNLANLTPRFAGTAQDPELIKSYVRSGLGIGLIAEMAVSSNDGSDLVAIDIGDLLPVCTAWAVLRRDTVARRYTLELLRLLAPRYSLQDVTRLLRDGRPLPDLPAPWWSDVQAHEPVLQVWPAPPPSNVTVFPAANVRRGGF